MGDNVDLLAKMYSLVARMNVAIAEIEGMKALNAERIHDGYTPGYDDAAFFRVGERLEDIEKQLMDLAGR